MGETRVDLQHLLEDLRDAYPGSIEETILTEIMANSLDSGATRIVFDADPAPAHVNRRGQRLGHAAARIGALSRHRVEHQNPRRRDWLCRRRHQARLAGMQRSDHRNSPRQNPRREHVAMSSRHRAPWKWVTPLGLISRARHRRAAHLAKCPLAAARSGIFGNNTAASFPTPARSEVRRFLVGPLSQRHRHRG